MNFGLLISLGGMSCIFAFNKYRNKYLLFSLLAAVCTHRNLAIAPPPKKNCYVRLGGADASPWLVRLCLWSYWCWCTHNVV